MGVVSDGATPRAGRSLNVGGVGPPPTGLLLVGLITVSVAVAGSWYTVAVLREVVDASLSANAWPDVLWGLLMAGCATVAWPLCRAFMSSRIVRRATVDGDVVAARVARSDVRLRCWVSIGYSAALILIVLLVQFFIANNLAVAKTFFYVPLIISTFPLVLSAFWLNVKLFLISEVLVLVWGLVVAVASLAPGPAGKPLRLIATAYVDIFRAIPVVLIIFLVGFGIPLTGVPVLKGLSQSAFAIIALTITNAAYVAEIYRAGIIGVHWSQAAAARSLGLSYLQTLRFVVIPQGVRQIIPPLLNSFIALQKDTALVSVVGAVDAFNQSMMIASNHYNLSAVSTVAILFIVISIPQTRFVERMMQRDRARMRADG